MSSKKYKNDASCFAVFRLLKNSANNDYLRDVIYIETCTGQHSEAIALRMRKLFDEYECDYMVMDAHGLGLPIFDLLVGNAIVDESTGTEYYPLACMNNEELNERCLYPNNPKVIYAIKASAQLNSDMAICLQNSINTRKFRLLENESEGKDYITRFSEYDKFSGDLIGKLKSPYVQTTLAIYEMLTLEAERKDDGKIRVREQSGKRKDRYSAIVMGNYFATELARKNFKKNIEVDEEDEYVLSFGFD